MALGSSSGSVQHIRTEAEQACLARKEDCPDEALITYLTDSAFKVNSPLEFVISSNSVD